MKIVLKVLCVVVLLGAMVCPSFGMTDNQKLACHAIIHASTAMCSGTASVMAQVPGLDNIPLAVEIGAMTLSLAVVFDVPLGKMSAETLGLSLMTYFGGYIAIRTATQWLAGWLPFVGNTLNGISAAGLVEFIGWTIADAFDNGSWATLEVFANAKDLVEHINGINSINRTANDDK